MAAFMSRQQKRIAHNQNLKVTIRALTEFVKKRNGSVFEKTAVEDACKIEHVLSAQSFQAIKKHITQGNELPAQMKEEE